MKIVQDIHERIEILPTLYFFLKNAYLINNKTDCEFFMNNIKKLMSNFSREDIQKVLSEHQIKDLFQLSNAIKNNLFFVNFGDNYNDISKPYINTITNQLFQDEKELEKTIVEPNTIASINKLLGINLHTIDTQYETKYGKIDVLAKDNRTIYIIELKKDTAGHAIIGQLLKYAHHFQRRLIYNLWDEVKLITIAGNYTEYTYTQLKQMNAFVIAYKLINNDLILENI